MIFLKEFDVKHFRGINNLKVNNLGNINLIVGDNNSGKTSFLESIMLLRNTSDFSNILNVVRLRNNNFYSPFRLSTFENFLNMFNPNDKEKTIAVYGVINNKDIGVKVTGVVEKVILDIAEFHNRNDNLSYEETETAEFQGMIESINEDKKDCQKLLFNSYTKLSGLKVSKPNSVEMVYVSPTDHTNGNVFSMIVRDDNYKKLVLQVVKIFDKDIDDILYIKNDQTSRPIECLNHKILGIMPLATYGDGIKKVLLLANCIAQAKNGILLIDEIETAIHSIHYNDIFKFVIQSCNQFNIQLFATTHSIETVDSFLATQCDNNSDNYMITENDIIKVVTFRKNIQKNKTDARVLSGKEVFENRRKFDFEVRL